MLLRCDIIQSANTQSLLPQQHGAAPYWHQTPACLVTKLLYRGYTHISRCTRTGAVSPAHVTIEACVTRSSKPLQAAQCCLEAQAPNFLSSSRNKQPHTLSSGISDGCLGLHGLGMHTCQSSWRSHEGRPCTSKHSCNPTAGLSPYMGEGAQRREQFKRENMGAPAAASAAVMLLKPRVAANGGHRTLKPPNPTSSREQHTKDGPAAAGSVPSAHTAYSL